MTYATGHTKQIALENARAKLDAAAQHILNLKHAIYAYESNGKFCTGIDFDPTDAELRSVVYDTLTVMGGLFGCDELYDMANEIDPQEYDEDIFRSELAAEQAYDLGRVA